MMKIIPYGVIQLRLQQIRITVLKFEYEYLKVAKKEGFNFIVRDKNDNLYLYSSKPWKSSFRWLSEGRTMCVFDELFKFVKWEDEEPYSIDKILSNCEVVEDEQRNKI